MRNLSGGSTPIRHFDLAEIWQGAQAGRASESKSFRLVALFCATGLLVSLASIICGMDLGPGLF